MSTQRQLGRGGTPPGFGFDVPEIVHLDRQAADFVGVCHLSLPLASLPFASASTTYAPVTPAFGTQTACRARHRRKKRLFQGPERIKGAYLHPQLISHLSPLSTARIAGSAQMTKLLVKSVPCAEPAG
jgi:hypothetical protein